MKTIIAVLFIAVIIAGCTKSNDVTPDPNKSITGTTVTDTTKRLSLDDSLHMAVYNVGAQLVKTSVSGTNLILKFDENVALYLSAEGYRRTSAVHLLEDFKSTLLSDFDYTTVAQGGNITLNWVDDNLNNVSLKTVKDTVINNYSVVKINVNRVFTFFRVYDTNKLALNEQSFLLGKTGDQITFSSYTYYNQKDYPKTSIKAYVEYLK